MHIIGKQVFWPWAWSKSYAREGFTAIWEFNMPPSRALVKVTLSYFNVTGGGVSNTAHPHLISISRRKPDGSDEKVSFPDAKNNWRDSCQAYYDNNLTNVKCGLYVYRCTAKVMIVIEYWS
jgi:hypothetical protein